MRCELWIYHGIQIVGIVREYVRTDPIIFTVANYKHDTMMSFFN